ncbi:hypothetical protein D3C78_833740 [compost metagenome]
MITVQQIVLNQLLKITVRKLFPNGREHLFIAHVSSRLTVIEPGLHHFDIVSKTLRILVKVRFPQFKFLTVDRCQHQLLI